MQDHYKTLGVNSSATAEEIRRAYRVLARRYHPDVNPGKASEEKFKAISAAYNELSDPQSRQAYDLQYERQQLSKFAEKLKAYNKQQEDTYTGRRNLRGSKSPPKFEEAKTSKAGDKVVRKTSLTPLLKTTAAKTLSFLKLLKKDSKELKIPRLSIIEVSVTIRDAIFGAKKTIELAEAAGARKISIHIPPGVRSGSTIRMKKRGGEKSDEEIVLVIRVAQHPFISIQTRGLVVEIPVTISEALAGTSITIPTLDEPALLKIPAGSQSGSEVRLKGRGIKMRDGTQGDILYRLMIRVPESSTAVGITEKVHEIDMYYESPVRRNFPTQLLENI